MGEEIFRKKSLDKVKSPESLDDYIRVSNPGVWLLLIGVIVLLIGACVWGTFNNINSTVEASVQAEGEAIVCYVSASDVSSVKEGMTVKFDDFSAVITEIERKDSQEYICTLSAEQEIPSGFYDGKIVVESVKPLSFILN